jgi:hypothetical protein
LLPIDKYLAEYFFVADDIGLNGLSMSHGFNRYDSMLPPFDDTLILPFNISMGLYSEWNIFDSNILPRMKEMLRDDIPFPLSIGPGEAGVIFYDINPQKYDPYNLVIKLGKNNEYDEFIPTYVNGHYVTVTGMMIDDVKNKKILEISSWGKKYYIDYDQYINQREFPPFSNILYITKK